MGVVCMQYQTKWMMNMLKLFASQQSSLRRTLLVASLLIGSLGIAFVSLQQSLQNAQARPATSQHSSKSRSVSITVSSHIDDQMVTYTLVVHTGAHAAVIRRGIPITFTDSIPVGLSQIRIKGSYWHTKVSSKVGPSLVTGTYEGSYPIGPGATLPAVIIEGTINHSVSNVLTNSASVDVGDNNDKMHDQTVVKDNIQPQSLLTSQNNSNICSDSCSQQGSNPCASQCGSQQSASDACASQCDSQQSARNACINQCAQTDIHTFAREQVNTSVSGNESADTSCECNQQSTNIVTSSKQEPHGKGSTIPFPTLPNTGSDPNYKG